MNSKVRLVNKDELDQVLALYEHLLPDDPKLEIDLALNKHWNEILSDPNLFYLVAEVDGRIVSTCNITIIKNLTRSARPFGFIENVVTHPDYRNKGLGTDIINHAIEIAKNHGCYKVMLMTSRKEEETLRFYENVGFNRYEKTGFILRI